MRAGPRAHPVAVVADVSEPSNTPSVPQSAWVIGPKELELQGQAFAAEAIRLGDQITVTMPDGAVYYAEVFSLEVDPYTGALAWTARGIA